MMDKVSIPHGVVKRALQELSRDRSPSLEVLGGLAIVHEELREDGLEDSPEARAYEIGQVIESVVRCELARLRELAFGSRSVSDGRVLDELRRDFASGNRELEAWSAVYYVYVRGDLSLDLRGLTALLGDRHRRTLQRRLRRGVAGVARVLVACEVTARRRARTREFARSIPDGSGGHLYGRASLVGDVVSCVRQIGSGALVLAGMPGVGKSEVARRVALAILGERGVVWISGGERPGLHEDIRNRVEATLERVSVREKQLVIVDDISTISELEGVLRVSEVANGRVMLLVSRVRPVYALVPVFVAGLLGADATRRMLVERLAAAGCIGDETVRSDLLETVVRATCGHPAAIRAAAEWLCVSSAVEVVEGLRTPRGFGVGLCEAIWRRAWAVTEPGVREVVRRLACGEIDVELENDDALRSAFELGYFCWPNEIRGTRGVIEVSPFVRQFVEGECVSCAEGRVSTGQALSSRLVLQ